MVARRQVRRRLKTRYWSVFRSRSGVGRLWFRSHPVSRKRINSIPILAAAQIPVQMEFLVRTGLSGRFSEGFSLRRSQYREERHTRLESPRRKPLSARLSQCLRFPLEPETEPRFDVPRDFFAASGFEADANGATAARRTVSKSA